MFPLGAADSDRYLTLILIKLNINKALREQLNVKYNWKICIYIDTLK